MTKKRILLRDLITRLAQSDPTEIYIEVDVLEQDVFVLPLSSVLDLGVLHKVHSVDGLLRAGPVLERVAHAGLPGNGVAPVLGAAAEVWEIRSISITSAAGATYTILLDTVKSAPGVAVGAAATDELVNVALPVLGDTAIQIDNGLVGDSWNLIAVRLL